MTFRSIPSAGKVSQRNGEQNRVVYAGFVLPLSITVYPQDLPRPKPKTQPASETIKSLARGEPTDLPRVCEYVRLNEPEPQGAPSRSGAASR